MINAPMAKHRKLLRIAAWSAAGLIAALLAAYAALRPPKGADLADLAPDGMCVYLRVKRLDGILRDVERSEFVKELPDLAAWKRFTEGEIWRGAQAALDRMRAESGVRLSRRRLAPLLGRDVLLAARGRDEFVFMAKIGAVGNAVYGLAARGLRAARGEYRGASVLSRPDGTALARIKDTIIFASSAELVRAAMDREFARRPSAFAEVIVRLGGPGDAAFMLDAARLRAEGRITPGDLASAGVVINAAGGPAEPERLVAVLTRTREEVSIEAALGGRGLPDEAPPRDGAWIYRLLPPETAAAYSGFAEPRRILSLLNENAPEQMSILSRLMASSPRTERLDLARLEKIMTGRFALALIPQEIPDPDVNPKLPALVAAIEVADDAAAIRLAKTALANFVAEAAAFARRESNLLDPILTRSEARETQYALLTHEIAGIRILSLRAIPNHYGVGYRLSFAVIGGGFMISSSATAIEKIALAAAAGGTPLLRTPPLQERLGPIPPAGSCWLDSRGASRILRESAPALVWLAQTPMKADKKGWMQRDIVRESSIIQPDDETDYEGILLLAADAVDRSIESAAATAGREGDELRLRVKIAAR